MRPILPALAGAAALLAAVAPGVVVLELGAHVHRYGPGRVVLECAACHGGIR
jgi:hypothetical protein